MVSSYQIQASYLHSPSSRRSQAVQEIVPALLQLLRSSDPASAAHGESGLREVAAQRPQAVVPYLLPKLCSRPISLANASAIGAVAEVAGAAMHTQLDAVLGAILEETYLEAELMPEGKTVSSRRAIIAHAAAFLEMLSTLREPCFLLGERLCLTCTKMSRRVPSL